MTVSVLSVRSLHCGYKDEVIVKDVSLDIHAGEVLGLVGLNGAGKTTLIKTITGLRQPFSGELTLPPGRNFAYLPERFDPPWFLKGREFIRFSLKFYGRTIKDDEIESMADKISLNIKYLDEYVHSYSKGMRQKLGLLATVLTGCPLLILDEPMSGLDPKARHDVKELLRAVKKEGRSVFLSSHILADVAELCDRVAVFHNNTVIFEGSPQEMLEKGGEKNPEKAFLSLIAA
jgi:ABC-2 type transport system ATP-binding protein